MAVTGIALQPGSATAVSSAATTLTATAPNSYSVDLSWSVPTGTATVQLLRAGRLVDAFPATAGSSYVDRLLWQRTGYTYELKSFAAGGALLGDVSASVTTPAQVGGFPKLYANTSFWNKKIGARATVDPDSAQIVAKSVVPYAAVANLNNNDTWGIPLAYGDPASELYSVGCLNYGCGITVNFRIPRYAQANFGSDGKLVVIDPTTNTELDMGRATYDAAADTWTTGSRYTTPSDGWGAMCANGLHCDGVLMSGIDQFGGMVRPEEIAQGHIDHALALSIPYWRLAKFVCPAVKSSGGGFDDPNALPEGARVQLDPSFNVDAQTWPAWEKTVAKALQTYGAYVVDAGSGSFEVRAESDLDRGYDGWALVGVNAGFPGSAMLSDIPWNLVRVLKLRWC